MSKFHDRYHTDKSAEEDGTWADFGDGIKIKLRRHTSAHSKACRRKLEEPFTALIKGGQALPEDVLDDLLTKQLAQSLIMDWVGVDDEDGTVTGTVGAKVESTPEMIEKLLVKYPDFRNEISARVMDRSTFRKQVREADQKNS